VTLSIAGLSFTDESEIDSIPGARRMVVDDAGDIKGEEGGTVAAGQAVAQAKIAGSEPPAIVADAPTAEDVAKAEAIADENKELLRAISEVLAESCGKAGDGQAKRKALLKEHFGTTGWTPTTKLDNDALRSGLSKMRAALDTESSSIKVAWKDKFDMLDDFARIKADLIHLAGPSGEAEYYRVLKANGVEKSNQFDDMKVAMKAYRSLCEVKALMESMKSPRDAHLQETGA
jgi:hypothetical protein